MSDEQQSQGQPTQGQQPHLGGAVQMPQPPEGASGGHHSPQVVYAQPPGYGGRPPRPSRLRWLFILALLVIALVAGIVIGMAALMAPSELRTQVHRDGDKKNVIAIVPVEGLMDDAQAQYVTRALRELEKRDEVKAIVLRVDSPGGYVTPSDEIARAVRSMRQSGRNVVASFGDLAASGGYYCAVLADEIIAQPTTLTGSIGVIGQTLVLAGLMEKVGIEPIVMVADGSPQKRLANQTYQAWTEDDRAELQRLLDWYYEQFLARVREGRGDRFASEEDLRKACGGRVFPAEEALSLALIDRIGYLDDAIERAAILARLPMPKEAHVIRVEPPRRLPWPLGGVRRAGSSLNTMDARMIIEEAMDADRLRLMAHDLSRPRAMYLMR